MRPTSRAAIVLVAGFLTVPALAAQASAGSTSARVTLAGSASAYAAAHRAVAGTDAGQQVSALVLLKTRDAAGAEALAAAVSDPASPSYRHYVTAAQYRARFAPTDAQLQRVTRWLRGAGLQIAEIPANHLYVSVTGSAAAARKAFGVNLRNYAFRGAVVSAPTNDASVPRAVAGDVQGVTGLDESAIMEPADRGPTPIPPPAAFVNAPPCSTYYGQKIATSLPKAYGKHQPYVVCGYVAHQLRGAYGLTTAIAGGLDGSGQTVAILDAYASPTMRADADRYFGRHGLPRFKPGQYTEVFPSGYSAKGPCAANGWFVEEALDVDAVHSMAPGANIVYNGARSCHTPAFVAALNKIVDGHLAQIVSDSWGSKGESDAASRAAFHQVFTQAAAEGIGVYFSSGDNGDELGTLGKRRVDSPVDDPLVTGVGGTSLGIGKSDQYLFETGWGTGQSVLEKGKWVPNPPGDFISGAGGGTSRVFAQPGYQKGVVPAAIANFFPGGAHRAVPDVAMDADNSTGLLVGLTQSFPSGPRYGEYRVGGTSLACPLFAAVMALADQRAGAPHGFANPALYAQAGTPAFHDIRGRGINKAVVRVNFNNGLNAAAGRTTLLRSLNDTGSIYVRPGYDDVTGIGTVRGPAFLQRLG